MEKVVVAFARGETRARVRELLERTGTAQCLPCKTAAEVRRAVSSTRVAAVICGYKFPDGTAEELAGDLPSGCPVLVVAVQDLLELCGDGVRKLPAPVAGGALEQAVRTLLQERLPTPRSRADREIVEAAKAILMARGITEGEAHRLLQKQSMDSGAGLVATARKLLQE